jgi:glycerol uptake facilitator-like aquaporin
MLVQCLAAFAGVAMAHGMFDLPVFSASQHVRTGPSQWGSEVLATFGLLMVILGCVKHRAGAVPYAVGAYIAGAYGFTSSTSFANPAVTLARAATDTFAGIRPDDAPAFIAAQLAGALFALYVMRWLLVESKD